MPATSLTWSNSVMTGGIRSIPQSYPSIRTIASASRTIAFSSFGTDPWPARPRRRAAIGRLQLDRVPADLADRLGAVREQLGPVPYDPLRSPDTARLLV